MNNSWTKRWTALSIEYHWWRIRRLRRIQAKSTAAQKKIRLHRYRADQLGDYYEILSGIRDFDHRVIE